MKSAMEALTKAQHKVAEALYKQAGPSEPGAPGGPEPAGTPGAEAPGGAAPGDVIDAEVVDEK
jgi:hypothetical protein